MDELVGVAAVIGIVVLLLIGVIAYILFWVKIVE
jgi:hypothetical protein